MVSWVAVLCSLAVVWRHAVCVSAANLLPYGTEYGDARVDLYATDSSAVNVTLPESFSFLGEAFSTIHVNSHGALEWGALDLSEQDAKMIAPYLADADTISGHGDVFYRSTNNSTLLEQVANVVTTSFASLQAEDTIISSLFIATWHRIRPNGGPANIHNTFQCVLAYSGGSNESAPVSFVLFLYKEGGIQWSQGAEKTSEHALVGLRNGNNHELILPASRTSAVLEVALTNNTGVPGQWLFRVDGDQVELPAPLVGLERVYYPRVSESAVSLEVCLLIQRGGVVNDITVTLTVNEAISYDVTFPAADVANRQCADVYIDGDDMVEPDERLSLVVTSNTDPLVILPSTAVIEIIDDDILVVSPLDTSLRVQEDDENSLICVFVSGRSARNFELGFTLTEGTARDGIHYEDRSETEQIQPAASHCFIVPIIDNAIYDVGGTDFSATLTSSDPAIRISTDTIDIHIIDNDASDFRISFTDIVFTGSEDDPSMDVCTEIKNGQLGAGSHIDVNLTTNTLAISPDRFQAVEKYDYAEAERVLRFDSSTNSPLCLSVPIIDDAVLEESETYLMEIIRMDKTQEYDISPRTVRAVIDDNDSVTGTVESTRVMVREGARTNYATVCVTIDGEREVDLDMRARPRPGNATGNSRCSRADYVYDYVNKVVNFKYLKNDNRACARIQVCNDFRLESLHENFYVDITATHPRVLFSNNRVEVIIEDGDILRVDPLDIPTTVHESEFCNYNTTGTFCAVTIGKLDIDVAISFHTLDATAVAGEDYIPFNITTVIRPQDINTNNGGGQFCASFCTTDDIIVEGIETFYVVVSPLTDRVTLLNDERDRIVVTIKDDDVVRVFPATEVILVEEDDGYATVCASMIGLTERPVEITISTSDDTAIEGIDYVITDDKIRFESYLSTYGHLNASQVTEFSRRPPVITECVDIAIVDDDILEQVKSKEFSVFFSSDSLSSDRLLIESGVRITIHDNDRVILSLESSELDVNEGSQRARIQLSLVGAADFPITASIHTQSDAGIHFAIPDQDYSAVADSVVLPAYYTAGDLLTNELTVPIRDDNLLEDTESFQVVLESDGGPGVELGSPHVMTILIEDNDYVTVSLTNTEFRVLELNEFATVCCELFGAIGKDVAINISSSPGTAQEGVDYLSTPEPTQFEFTSSPVDHQTLCVQYSLLDDEVLEAVEKFSVTISTTVSRVDIDRSTATVSLVDNDGVYVSLVESEVIVEEDGEEGEGGEVEMCVRMTGIIETEVNILLFTEAGSAEAGEDFSPGAHTIVFPPMDVGNQTICKTFTYLNDDVVEDTEQFFVNLTTIGPGNSSVDIVTNRARVLIVDSDSVSVDFQHSRYFATEGDEQNVLVCVELGAPVEKKFTVQFSATADTAQHYSDFHQNDSQLVFESRGDIQACAEVVIMDDDILENDEQFSVDILLDDAALYIASDSTRRTSSAVVVIGDNDHVSVSLESAVYTVGESDDQLSVCSTLSGRIGKTVTLTFSSQPGSAQAERDYSAEGKDIVFQSAEETERQTVCVDVFIIDDDILEYIETFHLEIVTSVPRVTIPESTAIVRVVDDDSVDVYMATSELSVEEEDHDGVEVCVVRVGVIEREIRVELHTVPGSAQTYLDFNDFHRGVTFPPSPAVNETACRSVYVLHDGVVEATETFLMKLTTFDPSVINIIGDTTVVSILDTDSVSVDFEQAAYTVGEEDEEVRVCVVLGTVVERTLSVRLATSEYTALGGHDFTETDIQLSFEPRNLTRVCTSVAIENDIVLEDNEQFLISLLTNDSGLYTNNAADPSTSTVSVTIVNDDEISVGLVRGEIRVEEESGQVEVCAQLAGVIERDVWITLSTLPDTAHAGEDFIEAYRDLLFHPTLSSVQVNCTTFSIIDDETVEATESFDIQLTAGGDQTIIVKDRSTVVIEDVDIVSVDFVQLEQTVSESDAVVTVCVELGAEVQSEVTVQLATDDSTAVHPADFIDVYVEMVFEPHGDMQHCVDIQIVDNNVLENEEQFFVYIFDSDRSRVVEHGTGRGFVEVDLGSGGGEVVLSGGVRSEVTIVNDDHVYISVESADISVEESERDVTVCLVMEGEMERNVDITVQTQNDVAKGGIDYFHLTRTMTFGPRSAGAEECVQVQLINDGLVEADEKFTVKFSSRSEGSGVILDPSTVSILIIDDDVACERDTTMSPYGDYTWVKTKPSLIELPCQHGDDGMARRLCDEDGIWGEVDLEECYGAPEDVFPYLDKMPFNCETFSELLKAVKQATNEKDFEPYYVAVVARFFSDFADITERDGYVVEDHVCLQNMDSFALGVHIIDQLIEWPRDVLWTNSTRILRDYEAVSEHLVVNPDAADRSISLSRLAFSSYLDERSSLEADGIMREFSGTKRATVKIADQPSDSDTILGTIHLPPSLFRTLNDKELTEVGVWFSLHRVGSLFPLPPTASENDSVSTPIISATVAGQTLQDLPESEPVRFSLRLHNQSVTVSNCASWNYGAEEWITEGCETISVKDGYITCSCTHLTNFAGVGASLLPAPVITPEEASLTLSVISLVGVMLGLLALCLTLFALLAYSKLRRRRTTILRTQLCVSLLVLLLAYAGHILINYTTTLPQDVGAPCTVVSVITHYFTLTSLVWLGAETLLMFRKLVFDRRLGDVSNLYFVTVSATSWIVPFPLAAIPTVLNRDWMVTEDKYCFISHWPVLLTTFIVPVGILLLFNTVVYLVVMSVFIKFSCKKAPSETGSKKNKLKKSRRQATVRLIFTTPATTIFFIFAWLFAAFTFLTSEASIAFHLLSALFTAALGWFIFVYYIATAKDTRKLVHDAFCGKPKKKLNTNQFISMESLGKASGIDESDSDSDYPEREKRYGEFDVTYIGRKGALIEQKFSVRFMKEGGEGADGSGNTAAGESPTLQSASDQAPTPSSQSDDKPSSSSSSQDLDTDGTNNSTRLAAILEEPVQQQAKSSENSGNEESTVQVSPHTTSQEDENSDEGSPKTAASRKTFLPPSGQVVFTVTPTT